MPSSIDMAPDLSAFFEAALVEAERDRGLSAPDGVHRYLVGLLADHARPGNPGAALLGRPLSLHLGEALQATGQERFERLRVLGDEVLYLSGFFAPHLSARGASAGFAGKVGARAYAEASAMLRHGAQGSGSASRVTDLFEELARSFAALAEVLAGVADRLRGHAAVTNRDVLDLYERWLRSGSPELAGALAVRGLAPGRGDGTVH